MTTHDDPLSVIAAELGQTVRVTASAIMHHKSMQVQRQEAADRQRQIEHREALALAARKASEHWKSALTEIGGDALAKRVSNAPKWRFLVKDLSTHQADGRDVKAALTHVLSERSIEPDKDAAAILQWRVNKHLNERAELDGRMATGPGAQARDWLDVIANAGNDELASRAWESPAWNALEDELRKTQAVGLDAGAFLSQVIPQRDFADGIDVAAILQWRVEKAVVKQTGGITKNKAAVIAADAAGIGDDWQRTPDNAFTVKPKSPGPKTSKPSQASQFRPRYNQQRPPDIER